MIPEEEEMLAETIDSDLKAAMRGKDAVKLDALRMLKAAIHNKEIEKRVKHLSDDELLEVIQKQVKQRKDSITEFKKASRDDLVAKESRELELLERYLPKALSEVELRAILMETIRLLGVTSQGDVGQVMKAAMPKIKGRADGKLINEVALSLLKG